MIVPSFFQKDDEVPYMALLEDHAQASDDAPPLPQPTYSPSLLDSGQFCEPPFEICILERLEQVNINRIEQFNPSPQVSPDPPTKKAPIVFDIKPNPQSVTINPPKVPKEEKIKVGIPLEGIKSADTSITEPSQGSWDASTVSSVKGGSGTPPDTPPSTPPKKKQSWRRVVDSTSGKTYYYHPETKEARWDKPEGFDEQDHPSVKSRTPPEKGEWKSATDKEGRIYYYHTGNKETSWAKPDDFDDEHPNENEKTSNEKAQLGGWKKVVDSATGRTYYYMARWDKPEDFDEAVDTSYEEKKYTEKEAPGYEEKKSTEKEATGYEEKKATKKEAPSYEEKKSTEKEAPGYEEKKSTEKEAPGYEEKRYTEKEAPGRWKRVFDSSRGQTYYYHSATKETRWDKPEGFDEQKKQSSKKGRWKCASDKEGRTYYYHTGRKELSWDKPDDFDVEQKPESQVPAPERQVELTTHPSPPSKTTETDEGGKVIGPRFVDCNRLASRIRCILREEEEEAAADRRLQQLEHAYRIRAEERAQHRAEEEEARRIRGEERRIRGEPNQAHYSSTSEEAPLHEAVRVTRKKTPREMEEIWARTNGWRR